MRYCFLILLMVVLILILSPLTYKHIKETFSDDTSNRASMDVYYLKNDLNKSNQPTMPPAYMNIGEEGEEEACGDPSVLNTRCPGICSQEEKEQPFFVGLQKQKKYNNPVQVKLNSQVNNQVSMTATSGSDVQSTDFSVVLLRDGVSTALECNCGNGINAFYFTRPRLQLYNNQPNYFKYSFINTSDPVKLVEYIKNVPNDSYILVGTQGNITVAGNAFINNYLSSMRLLNGNNSYMGLLYKKPDGRYLIKRDIISDSSNLNGASIANYSLTGTNDTYYTTIKEGDEPPTTELIPEESVLFNEPYMKYRYVLIRPSVFDKYLSFSAEQNNSNVFLSVKTDPSVYPLYSESPQKSSNIVGSKVYLKDKTPQKWTIVPRDMYGFSNFVYIRTYERPYYYLECDNSGNGVRTTLVSKSSNQIWRIERDKTQPELNRYTIQSMSNNKYLSYWDNGGYLYNDRGKVMMSLNKMYWSFTYPDNDNRRVLPTPPDIDNRYRPMYARKDYPVNNNQRGLWNTEFNSIWNGRYAYSFPSSDPLVSNPHYIRITMNSNGRKGKVLAENYNYTWDVVPVGSNILISDPSKPAGLGGKIYIEMITKILDYKNNLNNIPIKIRFLFNDGVSGKYINMCGNGLTGAYCEKLVVNI